MSKQSDKKPKTRPSVWFLRSLALLYFVLLGCCIAYVWLLAQSRYTSIASFKISRQSPSSGEMSFAQLAVPGLSDTGSVDSQIAIGFVNSADMLIGLEDEFKLQEHFSAPKTDFVFRLKKDALLDERLEFYRDRIFAHFDKETGLTMLTVDSYDANLSKKLADTILKRTEDFINHFNQTVADQQVAFVREEITRAEKQVKDVSMEILALQNSNNLINPDAAITANLKIIHELKMDQLRAETTLASLIRDSPNSPRIENLRSHLRSLEEQIALEATKLSGPEQNRLNQILARYKELDLRLEFANKLYTSTLALFEKNRLESSTRSRFVSVIQHPFLPEDPSFPKHTYASISLFVVGLLVFMILRVFIHSIMEKI